MSGISDGAARAPRPTHADVARLAGGVHRHRQLRAEQVRGPTDLVGQPRGRRQGRQAVGLPAQRRGLLQVQVFETEDDQHVVEAIKSVDPIAVTSLFPLSNGARTAAADARVPLIEIGLLPALGDPHLAVGALRVDHLIARGHRQLAFAYTGIAKWRALGDYWLDGITTAARAHALPPVAVDAVTVENAVEVITRWHRTGVTAVCAQSDEVAALVLYGIREAGLTCPGDIAVIGVDAHPISAISSPPLTTVEFDPAAW